MRFNSMNFGKGQDNNFTVRKIHYCIATKNFKYSGMEDVIKQPRIAIQVHCFILN